jgi:transcription termination/antitermination protein NusA
MQPNLNMVIDQVGKDKNIDRKILVQTLEQAILTAAKRSFGLHREMEAQYNEDSGAVDLFLIVNVVENVAQPGREISLEDARSHGLEAEMGDELLFQIFYRPEDAEKAEEQDEKFGDLLDLRSAHKHFGRIAAQTAKQVIYQRVREAERENVFNEYKDRKGELITGICRRFERGNIIVDLGRAEAILPVREQVPRESYRAGDRIVAFVLDIDKAARGPQIVLSRTHKGLLEKLFEMEVPEIYEKIVRIESSAREPGARAKIAVSSRDRDVDPVGACVGMKGSRVQAVVQELRGEKIDIVPYDDDPARFVCNAIAPAEVSRVIIDAEGHRMELIVPDDKLSLAIGKKGQNVRLASQLTGWKIDIHSESKIRELEAQAKIAMADLANMGTDMAETVFKLGWRSVPDLADAVPEELAAVPGLGGVEAARKIKQAAARWMEQERARALAVREESQRRAKLSDDQRLLEIKGMDKDVLGQLKGAGITSIEQLAREQDLEKLNGAGISPKRAAYLQHFAKVWLGELPLDAPAPEGPEVGDEGWN